MKKRHHLYFIKINFLHSIYSTAPNRRIFPQINFIKSASTIRGMLILYLTKYHSIMKNVFFTCLLVCLIISSCSKDDDNSEVVAAQDATVSATINGGSFNDYSFDLGVYATARGTAGNTISIDLADPSGTSINLFLNGTDGFDSGTVKTIGNVDSDSFKTNAVIRDSQSLTYFSSTGTISITGNRAHPTQTNLRLISGTFNINAATIDGASSTALSGTFTELEY